MKGSTRKKIYIGIAVICAVILLLSPIEIPYTINATGKIVPSKEWLLVKDRADRLAVSVSDRTTGVIQSYLVHQFERADAVQFSLSPAIIPGGIIREGELIGSISSAEVEYEVARLTGELATAEATLDIYQTGEKASVVREAERRLAYAKQQAEGHEKLLARMRLLYEKNLISRQEYELVETSGKLYEENIGIAEALRQTALSGEKPEQINLGRARIAALRDEIKALRKKLDRSSLFAPFSGVVFRTTLSDTLVLIGNMSTSVAILPVKWKDRAKVMMGKSVTLEIEGIDKELRGIVRSIGNMVSVYQGEQVVLATVVIKEKRSDLLPGLIASCSISCPPLTPRDYLAGFFSRMFVR